MVFRTLIGSILAGSIAFCGLPPAHAENLHEGKQQPIEATLATTSYKVVSGDSLYTISKRFGVSISSLRNANGLKTNLIHPGQLLTIPGTVSIASFTPLGVGSSGSAVSTLQKNLKALGFYTYAYITGYYGTVTKQAVQRFQSTYSLPATGTVNSATNTQIWHALVKKRLVAHSFNFTGAPYVWGGETPKGFDCSGFVHYMFKYEGVPLPRTTSEELYAMGYWVDTAHLRPGDLVFFGVNRPGVISHVGFYVGGNKFISATSSKGIWTYPVTTGYWAKYYLGAKRIY